MQPGSSHSHFSGSPGFPGPGFPGSPGYTGSDHSGQGGSGELSGLQRLENWRHPRYEIFEELGRGGMGAVLRARHRELDVEVAIKLMLGAGSGALFARFQREARTLASLSHRHIVRILDFGLEGGLPFFAMEYLRGQDLEKEVQSGLRLRGDVPDFDWTAARFGELAGALSYCHENGVIHRDLKPQNLLIEEGSGRAVVVDFGLVKGTAGGEGGLSQTGEVIGTPAYMAPEQLDKEGEFGEPGPGSDVWGFGATLFYALTGEPPYKGASVFNIYRSLLTQDPPRAGEVNPAVPDWLDELCADCMTKDSAARPSMRELGARLEEGPSADEPRFSRRSLLGVSVLLAGLTMLGIFGALMDRTPPSILFNLPDRLAGPELVLEGFLSEPGCQLRVKGGARAKVEGRRFSLRLALTVGRNEFLLLAEDGAGNRSEQALALTREKNFAIGPDGEGGYPSLAAAIAAAEPGATITLASGSYVAGLVLKKPLRLIGEEGSVVKVRAKDRPVFVLQAGVELKGIELNCIVSKSSGSAPVLLAEGGESQLVACRLGRVVADGVVLKPENEALVELRGPGKLRSLKTVLIGDTGLGYRVSGGADLQIEEGQVEGCSGAAVRVEGRSTLGIVELDVEGCGSALELAGRARGTIDGLRVKAVDVGIALTDRARLEATDVEISELRRFGVRCFGRTVLELKKSKISAASFDQKTPKAGATAVLIEGLRGEASIEDLRCSGGRQGLVVARGSRVSLRGFWGQDFLGAGLLVDGAKLTGEEIEVKRARPNGLVFDHGAEVKLQSVLATETRTGLGSGIEVRGGSKATISKLRCVSNANNGVLVRDRSVLRVLGCELSRNGLFGLALVTGGRAELRNGKLNKNRSSGIYMEGGATVDLDELEIARNLSKGFVAYGISSSVIRRCRFITNQGFREKGAVAGMSMLVWGGAAVKTKVLVEDCLIEGQTEGPSVFEVKRGAFLELRRTRIRRCRTTLFVVGKRGRVRVSGLGLEGNTGPQKVVAPGGVLEGL